MEKSPSIAQEITPRVTDEELAHWVSTLVSLVEDLDSKYPHSGSQLSVTLPPVKLILFSELHRYHEHTCSPHTYMQQGTHTHCGSLNRNAPIDLCFLIHHP